MNVMGEMGKVIRGDMGGDWWWGMVGEGLNWREGGLGGGVGGGGGVFGVGGGVE